jgi:hypothetical protein
MVLQFADNRDPNSLASRLRSKRHEWFRSLISALPRPLTVLDVGGTETVWETIGFVDQPEIHITLVNIVPSKTAYNNISVVVGDGRDMRQYRDQQFDVVYSNSVIEHVGNFGDMQRMAREVRRVSKRYFLQTPNIYFPVEPHFVFPFFQFLPRPIQVSMVQKFSLGWIERMPDRSRAEQEVDSIRLLSWTQIRDLFPDAKIEREKLFGLTKSLIAYKM